MQKIDLKAINQIINYNFEDETLITEALTHASNINKNDKKNDPNIKSYDRLELLGDAVLQLLITEKLLKKYPHKSTGEISKLRSLLVCKESLSNATLKMGLNNFIVLGESLITTKTTLSDKILSDVVESVIGAVFMDSKDKIKAFATVNRIIEKFIWQTERLLLKNFSSKAILNEKLQKKQLIPVYQSTKVIAKDNKSVTFNVDLLISGKKVAFGSDKSKKIAEEMAATEALKKKF